MPKKMLCFSIGFAKFGMEQHGTQNSSTSKELADRPQEKVFMSNLRCTMVYQYHPKPWCGTVGCWSFSVPLENGTIVGTSFTGDFQAAGRSGKMSPSEAQICGPGMRQVWEWQWNNTNQLEGSWFFVSWWTQVFFPCFFISFPVWGLLRDGNLGSWIGVRPRSFLLPSVSTWLQGIYAYPITPTTHVGLWWILQLHYLLDPSWSMLIHHNPS